jgi:hypothetical protein
MLYPTFIKTHVNSQFIASAGGYMERTIIDTTKGVAGISRPFKSIVEQLGLRDDDRMMYVGLPGVCTPFVELLAYAIRTLNIKQVFAPNLDLSLARAVVPVENVGIQFGDPVEIAKAQVIVVLGGLAMPISPVSRDDVLQFLHSALLPGGRVVGISFMNMFEQVGWTSAIPFDFLIDATIDPVRVEEFSR